MSDKPLSKEEYLAALFSPEAFEEPYALLALRQRYVFASEQKAGVGEPVAGPDREQVSENLLDLSEQFFALDQATLLERLKAIPTGAFPDLQRFVTRLIRVAHALPVWQQACEDSTLDTGLMRIVGKVLIAPQKQATEQKRKTLKTLEKPTVQRRCSKLVKQLKRGYPEIYELESAWFDLLAKGKQRAKDSRRPANIGLGCLGTYIAFTVIARLLRMAFSND